ncbi:DUF308 domain-containing protein [Mycolicibacterium austroafricanum]|uniref:DUF308 domain-containing protein n=1 Tax=Mycolicibacterium austroafricanum TaxID=39687 RepID=UPI001CA377D7|nr:DUF308 domain-containing protein [Mycolicibacterium austroafricanum]QZT65283.1 DUF308 domain-containing protein [Mycolicibacterium austroafricanum]
MLIVALVLAVIGLAALVMAVVTSNELIAWVCIVASVIGVVLLIVDALRDRSKRNADENPSAATEPDEADSQYVEDYPDEAPIAEDYDDTPADDTVAVDVESDLASDQESPTSEQSPKN